MKKGVKRTFSSLTDTPPSYDASFSTELKKKKIVSVNENKFITHNLPPRDELRFKNTFKKNNEIKNYDKQTTLGLSNLKGSISPFLINDIQLGKENYRRQGCEARNVRIRLLFKILYPYNVEFDQELNNVVPIPQIFMRWAIVYSRGRLSDDFKFTNLFQDIDKNGQIITIDDYLPDSDESFNFTNSYSYIKGGNSFQGYEPGFSVIKEGFLEIGGYQTCIAETTESLTNGTFNGNPMCFSNSRYSFNGDQFKEFDISLLDENLLKEINGGKMITTEYALTKEQELISLEDINNGAIMFVYGISYGEITDQMPLMTIKSRIEYVDNG